ncbi:MaoC family dehydratase [Candidatus Nitrosotenuis chungbukensis]|uniref:MaoC family dehydratase n=1 Tax=Candidatus Nitrosotenuis chungbukensis TaxID=1353246 RepID=UPI002673CEFA|nr:MaoC family dehydratase [Candidatus Nitrosotenuis chungbukensis]WKT58310.1 MaoC family dehydratase [Candidatus Nitrosotenuis chungbukensis]
MTEQPTSYKLDDIEVGQKVKFTVTMDESMLDGFAKISGDYNPLHMDQVYAAKTSFGKRVCHGMLLASFFSRLVGMHLPGQNALYFSQTLNFQLPCFMGDIVTIEGQVTDKSVSTKIITIKTSAYNRAWKVSR